MSPSGTRPVLTGLRRPLWRASYAGSMPDPIPLAGVDTRTGTFLHSFVPAGTAAGARLVAAAGSAGLSPSRCQLPGPVLGPASPASGARSSRTASAGACLSAGWASTGISAVHPLGRASVTTSVTIGGCLARDATSATSSNVACRDVLVDATDRPRARAMPTRQPTATRASAAM